MSGVWFSLVGVVGVLLFVGWVVGMMAGGLGLLYKGARLMRRRTWRRAAARVDRVESDSDGNAWVHYHFALDGPGGAPQACSGSMIAAGYSVAGTLVIWYAEDLPSLQYQSPPHAGWQAMKGLLMMAGGLLFMATPALIFKPAWWP